MTNNLNREFEANLIQTFQALDLIDENKENVNHQPNENLIQQDEEKET